MTDKMAPLEAAALDASEAVPQPQPQPEKVKDPNVVEFDGPDDPENPMNWSTPKKTAAIALVTVMTFLSPVGSTISSAAASEIMAYFGSDSETVDALVTTIFILGYALGPLLIAPLSELYGRAILYKICIVLFVATNAACAAAPSLAALVVFRLLAGIMGSCPITLGAGTVADMIPAERRAGAMSAYVLGGVLGPSIGPICGGYLTPAAGWRWAFWFMAIISAPVALVTLFFAQESYPYVLLKHKTARLRRETGNEALRSALDLGLAPRALFLRSISRPLRMLTSPVVFALSLYVAVVYSYLYLCFTTFPRVFGDQYGFDSRASGLATLGLAVGSVLGIALCAALVDRLSAMLARRHGGDLQPEYRLPTMALGGLLVPIGLFWYGWSAEAQTHWILPIIGTGFIAGGMMMTFMASSMYLVDAFTVHAASVTAAATIFRCLCGGLLPLIGNAMHESLGVGWASSVLGFVAIAFMPLPVLFFVYGRRIREAKRFQMEF